MRRLLYIIFLFVITGCSFSNTHPKVLDEAERIMQKDPEAAFSKLNGIDISELKDSAMMARWALLYSEALVVNRLSAPTDTIINIAIDYYGQHNITSEFEKANQLKEQIKYLPESNELATALYIQKEKEFFLYKERVKHEQFMFVSALILLFAIGVILWMRQRIKLQNIQNNSLIAEASSLRNAIAENCGNVRRLEEKIHGLLDNRFSLIDSLCQTYYETQGTKAERKAIIDKVKYEIDAVRTNSFSEMEQAVNDCRDNILIKVKKHYPDIKPEDYHLLVFLAGGLSTRTISLLLGETVEVIYKRKSRLKSRLKEYVGPAYPDITAIF